MISKLTDHNQQELLQKVERYAKLMDASIRLPSGFRIGLDGIVGVVPGIGDALGFAASLYPITLAHQAGAPKTLLFKMGLSVAVEAIVGVIPVVGDIFDFWYKANLRNAKRLRQYCEQQKIDSGSRSIL